MVNRADVINAVIKQTSALGLSCRTDKVRKIGVGGFQITFTFKSADAPKVDPFKVGTVFQLGRRSYEVVGKNLRRWKFPVQVERLPDRRRFCVTIQSVQDGFLYVRGE